MDLPWIEKYRPSSLDELISHGDISKTISRFIDQGRLPHLLFYGPPGTGKTSTILAACKALYAPKEMSSMVLELNASDARGIGVVREQVLSFASTKTLFTGKFKLVILDEADSMTKDAQNALRRIIEKFTENTRFCLICNYLSKIIPAIQSRCTKFRFAPVPFALMCKRLEEISALENISLADDGKKAIYRFTTGDMRKAINLLQVSSYFCVPMNYITLPATIILNSASMSAKCVDEVSVYACVAYPSPSEIRTLMDTMLNQSISSAFQSILQTKSLKGIALQDMLTELHPLVMKINFPDSVRCDLLIALSEIEHRLSVGASERLQLGALLAVFTRAKAKLELTVV
ncbi:Replication factor C subunit 3 [Fasciola gigantica]|uniref:Replication factor C subunit 3 n=1 Tax=Fasciola gigantica TaxID=46835 RepID=A0A504Y8Z2_FASGI|nr:Replication factor C subunit 3 [Fasciola gigantica]